MIRENSSWRIMHAWRPEEAVPPCSVTAFNELVSRMQPAGHPFLMVVLGTQSVLGNMKHCHHRDELSFFRTSSLCLTVWKIPNHVNVRVALSGPLKLVISAKEPFTTGTKTIGCHLKHLEWLVWPMDWKCRLLLSVKTAGKCTSVKLADSWKTGWYSIEISFEKTMMVFDLCIAYLDSAEHSLTCAKW